MALVTSAEVLAAWPGFADLATDEKTALIAAASAAVNTYCMRTFESTTYTEYHDGQNLPRVWLKNRPVISITSVSISGTALDNTNSDAWVINLATGELVRGDGTWDPRFAYWFPRGTKNVAVVYVAGYATIPADVKRATILWLRYLSDVTRTSTAFQTERIGDYSYAYGDAALKGVPPQAALLLENYVQGTIL